MEWSWAPWRVQARLATALDEILGRIALRWAAFVHRRRLLILVLTTLVGMGLSTGLMLIPYRLVNRTEDLFTPTYSQANMDRRKLEELWPLRQDRFLPGKSFGARFFIQLICYSKKPDENVLDDDVLNEIARLNDFFLYNFSVQGLLYKENCLSYAGSCFGNEQIGLLLERRRLSEKAGVGRLYPVFGPETSPASIADVVGGARVAPDGQLSYAHALRLAYFFPQDERDNETTMNQKSEVFMVAMAEFLGKNFSSPLVRVAYAHAESLTAGMDETNERFGPNFIVSLGVLALFSILCNSVLKRRAKGRGCVLDSVQSRPLHAIAGLFSCSLALGSSFGLLLLLGVPFNGIANIIVFLVFSIGLDDMFILVAAWESSSERDREARLQETLRHAIVSVTITSLTDAVSFAIGCVSPLLGVRIFCIYATVAVVFDYIFQLSLYLACMDYLGQVEMSGRHCLFFYKVKTSKVSDSNSIKRKSKNVYNSFVAQFFRNIYAPVIFHPVFRVLVLLIGAGYVGGNVLGILRLEEGLVPGNIVMKSHHLQGFFKGMEEEFFPAGFQLRVGLTRAPDLSRPANRRLTLELTAELESTPYTMGYNSTVLWLRSFLAYLDELGAPVLDSDWHKQVWAWARTSSAAAQWEADIVWHYPTQFAPYPIVYAFQFQMGMRNIKTPYSQRLAIRMLREICAKKRYAELEVLAFNDLFPFVEQYEMVAPTTKTSLGLGLGSMAIISVFLIPEARAALLIILTILSIDVGVLGLMSWWGVRLDCVSMICLTMATGFAVDLSAHVTYAFLAAEERRSRDRVLAALIRVGWPVLQGGLSTLLGTVVLSTVDAYIVQTFFKTIFLVIGLGLIHSLIVLPVVLPFVFPDRRPTADLSVASSGSFLSTPSTSTTNAPLEPNSTVQSQAQDSPSETGDS